jgi:hypothetical protein
MLDIKNSIFDWEWAYGLTREDVYEQAFSWLADLPNRLQFSPREGKYTLNSNSVCSHTTTCLGTLQSDRRFYIEESTSFNKPFEIKCYFDPAGLKGEDFNATLYFHLHPEVDGFSSPSDDKFLRLRNVWISPRLRDNGLARNILASAATLAAISRHARVGCEPGMTGSVVWPRLGGRPHEIGAHCATKVQKELEEAYLRLVRYGPDASANGEPLRPEIRRQLIEWIGSMRHPHVITPEMIIDLARSDVKIQGVKIGEFVLKDIKLGYTFFDLKNPKVRETFLSKGVINMDATEAWMVAHRPGQLNKPCSRFQADMR